MSDGTAGNVHGESSRLSSGKQNRVPEAAEGDRAEKGSWGTCKTAQQCLQKIMGHELQLNGLYKQVP